MLMMHRLTRLHSAADASVAADAAAVPVPGRMLSRAAFRDERSGWIATPAFLPATSRRFHNNRHHRSG
jgi:hypothetical protein